MVMCWAPDCNHYNVRERCKFMQFPKDPKEKEKWRKFVRRSEEPGPGARLCSCHFPDGKRENGPTLYKHNINKRFNYSSPEKKKRVKRSKQTSFFCISNIGKPAALNDVNNPDWTSSLNMGHTKKSKKGLLSHNEEDILGMHDEETLEPLVKVEEVDFNFDQETQKLEESLRNIASSKKAFTDMKIKYLEEEHRVKMDILNIENENAEIQNETLKIEYEIQKINLINQRMLEIDN